MAFKMFSIAHRLGLTIDGVERMTASEFAHWIAYFKIIDKPQRG